MLFVCGYHHPSCLWSKTLSNSLAFAASRGQPHFAELKAVNDEHETKVTEMKAKFEDEIKGFESALDEMEQKQTAISFSPRQTNDGCIGRG